MFNLEGLFNSTVCLDTNNHKLAGIKRRFKLARARIYVQVLKNIISDENPQHQSQVKNCYPKARQRDKNEHPYWKVLTYLRKTQGIGPPNSKLEPQNCC